MEYENMNTVWKSLLAAGVMAFGLSGGARAQSDVDAALPNYEVVSGVSGTLTSVGSDTLNNVMTLWAEQFRKCYPNVKVTVEGKGSSTAPPALISGTAQLGPMSRKMKTEEIQEFEKRYGYPPTAIGVAIDALGVYVHKDNPVQKLTLEQLDAIFSSTRKRGADEITTWGQVGLTGEWAGRPVSLYGRNSSSGTYGYFKDDVLKKGDFKPTVKEQPGSSSVVQGIENEVGAIGYSGVGYKTSGVRVVPIAEDGESEAFEPSLQNAETFKYPITRVLYIYVNKPKDGQMDPLAREFLRFILSKQGQEVVVKDGYYPLPEKGPEGHTGASDYRGKL
jgi:phosphate transport system substrate-binding protein